MLVKRSALFTVLVVTLLAIATGSASAQVSGSVRDVEEQMGIGGKVDWTTGLITATGIGAPPASADNPAQTRGMAERAAYVVALRNLLESVKGVRVDSTTTVENFIVANDTVRTQVSGMVQGATILNKKYISDGSVEITLGVYLRGAMTDTLLPKGAGIPLSAASPSAAIAYTGLVVDARGLGVRPAMTPRILNEDGKEVYGSARINRDYAVREGMVGYLKDPAAAQANPRVADRPLVLKAMKVTGENRVDLVVSNADAAMLQSASQNLSFLEKCKVIILVD